MLNRLIRPQTRYRYTSDVNAKDVYGIQQELWLKLNKGYDPEKFLAEHQGSEKNPIYANGKYYMVTRIDFQNNSVELNEMSEEYVSTISKHVLSGARSAEHVYGTLFVREENVIVERVAITPYV